MRVLYVSRSDAHDVNQWSGIPYYLTQALSLNPELEVDVLSPLSAGPLEIPFRLLQPLHDCFSKTDYKREREPLLTRHYQQQIVSRVRSSHPDVVLTTSTIPVPAWRDPVPLAIWIGSTFHQMIDYYSEFANLSPRTIRVAEAAEGSALRQASLVIAASAWAAASVRDDYGVDSRRIRVIPWGGAEVLSEPDRATTREAPSTCRLLAVGRDWHRKGMDLAVETLLALRDRDAKVELDIVGARPPRGYSSVPGVRIHGWLDKSRPAQRDLLLELYAHASFFLALSRAECYGTVVNEALSAGTPVIATRTGGLASAVTDGETGLLVDTPVQPDLLSARLLELWADRDVYETMRVRCRSHYTEFRTWQAVGEAASAALRAVPDLPADHNVASSQT